MQSLLSLINIVWNTVLGFSLPAIHIFFFIRQIRLYNFTAVRRITIQRPQVTIICRRIKYRKHLRLRAGNQRTPCPILRRYRCESKLVYVFLISGFPLAFDFFATRSRLFGLDQSIRATILRVYSSVLPRQSCKDLSMDRFVVVPRVLRTWHIISTLQLTLGMIEHSVGHQLCTLKME